MTDLRHRPDLENYVRCKNNFEHVQNSTTRVYDSIFRRESPEFRTTHSQLWYEFLIFLVADLLYTCCTTYVNEALERN